MNIFFQDTDPATQAIKLEISNSIKSYPGIDKYDQYRGYYYKDGFSSEKYFASRIDKLLNAEKGDWIFFAKASNAGPYLIGLRLSKWDEEHFGFKMAFMQVFTTPVERPDKNVLNELIRSAIVYARKAGIKFLNSRVNGDHIIALHAIEDNGFRYYDDVIWPISSTATQNNETPVRLMRPEEIDQIKIISENFQYPRGHYYCDDRFDADTVNTMYPKWIETTVRNNEPIAVIDYKYKPVGLFVFKIDPELLEHTGYKYGRLRLLALDTNFRGAGLGLELFKGTLTLIKNMGADYIDSGYSTKNHISARLHTKTSFYSVYEEVTFHLWLD